MVRFEYKAKYLRMSLSDLRRDLAPDDLPRALVGVFHTTAMPGWEESARRLVDILIEGARSR